MSIPALEAKAAGKRQIEVSEDSEFQNRLLSNGGSLTRSAAPATQSVSTSVIADSARGFKAHDLRKGFQPIAALRKGQQSAKSV